MGKPCFDDQRRRQVWSPCWLSTFSGRMVITLKQDKSGSNFCGPCYELNECFPNLFEPRIKNARNFFGPSDLDLLWPELINIWISWSNSIRFLMKQKFGPNWECLRAINGPRTSLWETLHSSLLFRHWLSKKNILYNLDRICTDS